MILIGKSLKIAITITTNMGEAMEKDIINLQLLIPLVVITVVAISGWIVGHKLNAERELQNKRIELRIKYCLKGRRNNQCLRQRITW